MLHIHLYGVHIIYKPGPDMYIVDWLFQSKHTENRDQEVTGMNINAYVISPSVNIPICTSIEDNTILFLCKPWEVVGTDIIFVKNKTLLYIVDYHNKIHVVNKSWQTCSG